ncbi:ParA family protein [Clostridium sp. MT-14]|uniref:ParA family protein n=1 Tax=Clostridium sp. MT-14 TaxID=3348360 RepID=UPI0035F45529
MCNKNIVTFINMKGGVCKTTLCVNIANTLAEMGKRVLVIDLDPQFNATQYAFSVIYGKDSMEKYRALKKEGKTIFQIFKKEIEDINNDDDSIFTYNEDISKDLGINLIVNLKDNFDFMLGDIELIKMELNQIRGTENILDEYIEKKSLRSNYEYILIDSPPTYSFFFRSALIAADTYISPVTPDYVASLGLSLMTKAIKQTKKLRPRERREINLLGIVYTLINPSSTIHEPIIENINSTLLKNSKKAINVNETIRNLESTPFKEYIYRYISIQRGVEVGNFMYDIKNNDISRNIKLITEEFVNRMERINNE